MDGVVIATRHNLHASQVVAALQAGKSVFCEKPLCLNIDELREIVRVYLQTRANRAPQLMVDSSAAFQRWRLTCEIF